MLLQGNVPYGDVPEKLSPPQPEVRLVDLELYIWEGLHFWQSVPPAAKSNRVLTLVSWT